MLSGGLLFVFNANFDEVQFLSKLSWLFYIGICINNSVSF